eukprot:scaffold71342_cov65-Phaeocystis_antarctica.AAC.4
MAAVSARADTAVRWTTQWPGLLYKFGLERSTLQRNRIILSAPGGCKTEHYLQHKPRMEVDTSPSPT